MPGHRALLAAANARPTQHADNAAIRRYTEGMAKAIDPFKQLIWHATDRLYSPRTDITIDLDADPIGTIQGLITQPERFGTLRAVNGENRRQLINELVTLARAYVLNKRKLIDHNAWQPVLPLPPPPDITAPKTGTDLNRHPSLPYAQGNESPSHREAPMATATATSKPRKP